MGLVEGVLVVEADGVLGHGGLGLGVRFLPHRRGLEPSLRLH
jgi:hypothetical protein